MSVDLRKAIGHTFEPATVSYTDRDTMLYSLAIGCGAAGPSDPSELKFVYEGSDGFAAFPTFAVTWPSAIMMGGIMNGIPGLEFNPMMLLHGEQYLQVCAAIPTNTRITNSGKVKGVFDKGSGALLVVECKSVCADTGKVLAINESSLFIRGIGGFGGEKSPKAEDNTPPSRPPDATITEKTLLNQAMYYRLGSGDMNPLHVDPAMSAMGGFTTPILHGLCSFGFASRAVLKCFAGNDPSRFQSIRVRFAKHVFPGDELTTEMWQVSPTRIVFRCLARGEVVLVNAAITLTASAKL